MNVGADRSDVVEAIREYRYHRDALGHVDPDEMDTGTALVIDCADELVEAITAAMAIKRYEL